LNDYVWPTAGDQKGLDFKCLVCVKSPNKGLTENQPQFHELVNENPELLTFFGVNPDCRQTLFNRISLFKLRNVVKFVPESKISTVKCGRLTALHLPALLDTFREEVMSGSVSDDCLLCFETLPLGALGTACGKCKNPVCTACMTTWFSQTKPGQIVLPPHILCPFCKQSPKWKVVKRYNKRFAEVCRGGDNPFDPKWYSAWCVKCSKIRHCIEHSCSQGVPRLTDLFICGPCQSSETSGIETKPCPKCQAASSKTVGCNHITCPVRDCGAHWCYACGFLSDKADPVYTHMRRTHGGYGFGADAGDWASDSDDDYDY
jgi:hypothetical protein